MADVPVNRDRIVPVMAGRKPSARAQSASPAPQPAPRRTTRSQTKLLGLDNVSVNLKTLAVRGLYAYETKGDGTFPLSFFTSFPLAPDRPVVAMYFLYTCLEIVTMTFFPFRMIENLYSYS